VLYMDSFLILALIAAALLAGGYAAWNWWSSRIPSSAQIHGKPIATCAVGGMTVSLYGDLHNGQIQMLVRFTDSSGQLKDVGEVKTDLCRNMLDRVIHSRSDVTKTNTQGAYRAKIQPQMGGYWAMKLSWQGPAGEGQVEIPVRWSRLDG